MFDITPDNHDGADFTHRAAKPGKHCRQQSAPPVPQKRTNPLAPRGVERDQQIVVFGPEITQCLM